MTSHVLLGIFAIGIGLYGYYFYVAGIVRGTIKPHAFTWFVWGLLTGIAFIARSDWIFFTVAVLAIPLWLLTGNPLSAVIIITLTDAIAFAPTFRKAYTHPDTEPAWTYALSGAKFVVGLLALQTVTLTTALYPASLVVANFTFVVMLVWRRRTLRPQTQADGP